MAQIRVFSFKLNKIRDYFFVMSLLKLFTSALIINP